jgi:predicted nucleic acid-binding protein
MGSQVLSPSAAWSKVTEFLTLPEVRLLSEPHGLEETWERFSKAGRTSPNMWTDSYLAAFAAGASLRLVTFDRGFSRFDGLDTLILTDQ